MKRILKSIISAFILLCPMMTGTAGAAESFSWVADSLKTVELLNITVKDQRNAIATVRIGFSNPTMAFEISNVNADLIIDGRTCCSVATRNIIAVEKKSDKTYLTDVDIVIPEDANIFSILNVLKSRYKASFSLSASMKVAMRGGLGATFRTDIPLDGILKSEVLITHLLEKPFSISPLPGQFSVKSFDILYIDELGSDGFQALLEIGIDSPSLMKISPEIGIAGMMKLSGAEAFDIESVYRLDIKSGYRMYYIPVRGKLAEGFNPCALLNLLKSGSRETLSIVLRQPKIVGEKEITIFSYE